MVKVELFSEEDKFLYEIQDNLVSTILYVIMEVYQNSPSIELKAAISYGNVNKLSDFLNYIIAYPIGVDVPRIKLLQDSKSFLYKSKNVQSANINLNNDGIIVLASGGIDSTASMLSLIENNVPFIAFWCDYGQPYRNVEGIAIHRICKELCIPLIVAKVNLSNYIEMGVEKFKHVFPARNLLIASIAASLHPKHIILSGLVDEIIVPDKSTRMYSEAPDFLGCNIYSPFSSISKTEVLCVWKKRWNNILHVDETVTCYNAGGNCQNCAACAKRAVAKIASGYDLEFPKVFTTQQILISEHWLSRLASFGMPRRTDILLALYPFLEKFPHSLSLKIASFHNIYHKEIKERQRNLERLNNITWGLS
jgi:7-cyano-7-deazaguanine synthase in queuosine biosynthesis